MKQNILHSKTFLSVASKGSYGLEVQSTLPSVRKVQKFCNIPKDIEFFIKQTSKTEDR
jgi:hypothetical protein